MKKIAIGLLITTSVLMLFFALGARINTSSSIPLGLYWTSHHPIKKGAYVMFCPPDQSVFRMAKERGYIGAGFCPGGYSQLIKRVYGTKWDSISTNDAGLWIGNDLVPESKFLKADGEGRPLEPYYPNWYFLEASQVILMSGINALSFDSRYFGPIELSQIKSVVVPVWTWL